MMNIAEKPQLTIPRVSGWHLFIIKMKKFSQNGKTIVFYQKEGDEKFSFLIENEPELTEQLLANVSTKRVKEKDIRYAVKGIFEKIAVISSSKMPPPPKFAKGVIGLDGAGNGTSDSIDAKLSRDVS